MIALLAASLLGFVQDNHGAHGKHGHDHGSAASYNADIVVTINPEARVSVAVHTPRVRARCGTTVSLRLKVINQGYVTAPLNATAIGTGARHVAVDLSSARLTGRGEESRELRLRPVGGLPADVTIAFNISQEIGDLSGRDRVNLFVTCTNQ